MIAKSNASERRGPTRKVRTVTYKLLGDDDNVGRVGHLAKELERLAF